MEVAARRLSTTLHRSLQDIEAKAQLILHAQNDGGSVSLAENDVRTSVLAAVVAMAEGEDMPLGGPAAPRGVNAPRRAVHG